MSRLTAYQLQVLQVTLEPMVAYLLALNYVKDPNCLDKNELIPEEDSMQELTRDRTQLELSLFLYLPQQMTMETGIML